MNTLYYKHAQIKNSLISIRHWLVISLAVDNKFQIKSTDITERNQYVEQREYSPCAQNIIENYNFITFTNIRKGKNTLPTYVKYDGGSSEIPHDLCLAHSLVGDVEPCCRCDGRMYLRCECARTRGRERIHDEIIVLYKCVQIYWYKDVKKRGY